MAPVTRSMSRKQELMASRGVYKFKLYSVERVRPCRDPKSDIPRARSGHRCVIYDDHLYCFGGFNPTVPHMDRVQATDPDRPLFKELWKFNLSTRVWAKVHADGNVPVELASHAVALHGSNMLVYGGTGVPFGRSSSNSLNICNLKSMQWQKLGVKGTEPPKLYGQAIALVDDSLYVIGGTSGYEYSIDVHKLKLKEATWEELRSNGYAPFARYRHEIASDGKTIFVFGGGTSTDSFDLEKIPCFDLTKKRWEDVVTRQDQQFGYPKPRRCHSIVQNGLDVYLSGGFNGSEIFKDIWMLNMETLQWTLLPCSMPRPVYFHSAALTPHGCMYIFGGVMDIDASHRTNEVHRVWLRVPSLREISWEAVLFYAPGLPRQPRLQTLEMGVPSNMADRMDVMARSA